MSTRRQLLERLYDALVAELGRKIETKEATAADLQCARQLLYNAGINADPENPDGPTNELEQALREFDKQQAALQ